MNAIMATTEMPVNQRIQTASNQSASCPLSKTICSVASQTASRPNPVKSIAAFKLRFNEDKPSQALRHGRWKSSMWLAIDAVKKGEADVAVSAGNTGALMAMARFNLKMIEGIERPAHRRGSGRR